jgi:hypothetical protein
LFNKDLVEISLQFLPRAFEAADAVRFRQIVFENSHFNSQATRRRAASYLTRRFFPDDAWDPALAEFAKPFAATSTLRDVCYFHCLVAEPVLTRLSVDLLRPAVVSGEIPSPGRRRGESRSSSATFRSSRELWRS